MSKTERRAPIGAAPPNVVSKTVHQHLDAHSAFFERYLVLRYLIEARQSD
jgi:hypothetical protein